MAVVMKAFEDMRHSFSNRREWREFAAALQCPVSLPGIIDALRASAARFHDVVNPPAPPPEPAGNLQQQI
ncbi:MAG TPA: hypothetical protein VGI93_13170 [Steroidobacteraceae bacterium]|jgi:hypothetical protein